MATALVLDDSDLQRHLLRALLEEDGWAVIEARCLAEAAAAAERTAAAGELTLACVDWWLPDGDAAALCRRLRRAPGGERCAIVLFCADEGEVVQARGRRAGADLALTKTSSTDEIRAAIASALSRRAAAAARAARRGRR